MRPIFFSIWLLSISAVSAQPTLVIQQGTLETGFEKHSEHDISQPVDVPLVKGNYLFHLSNQESCLFPLGAQEDSRARFNKPIELQTCATKPLELKVRVAGNIQFTYTPENTSISLLLLLKNAKAEPYVRPLPETQCATWQGEPVTVNVSSQFDDNEQIRDFYSGQVATVKQGHVTLTPANGSNGLLLIEAINSEPTPFTWDNALVYFIMTDRFSNGDTNNDLQFNRKQDGNDEIGTFHGGDIKGVINKLDYIESLGINAIWMTPLIEQVHGFVGGGKNGEFPFYAYHGYWALDYTKLDPNFGTDEDLRTLVKEAHERDIRLIWDTVINHAGYATLADLKDFQVGVLNEGLENLGNNWQPGPNQNWHSYNQLIDYQSPNWNRQWWSNDWIRAAFPGYIQPGADDLSLALAGLPDYLTDSNQEVTLPPILANKSDTRAKSNSQTVIDHLTDWQTYWVREFGIDGFRSDTAKHVELEHWLTLKQKAKLAYKGWQAEQDTNPLTGDDSFWMVGEVFDHPLFKDYYYNYGFDSLINFEFQEKAHDFALCMSDIDSTYSHYANAINTDPAFNALSYISSHDTTLFYAKYQNLSLQKKVAAPFLLLPGGVQIYYGDETARPLGPYGDDFHQGTRSDMNWTSITDDNSDLLSHWQIIGKFRKKHAAIGSGFHQQISEAPYVFSRTTENDRVIIVFAGNEAN
ncbi:alpha-amylase [Reinekea sp.]|jgi:alpha-amylase|uniref:alpha-amylase n=1 Tax=Reinekea sp. TaxID=1970455 RepID=UPI0039895AFF